MGPAPAAPTPHQTLQSGYLEMAETVNDRLHDNARLPALAEMLPALQRLDALLEHAIAAARAAYGADAGADRFRGLYVSDAEVQRLLQRAPGAPLLWCNGEHPPVTGALQGSRLARLKQLYGLGNFDLDILLIALAPELDRRYERLYAYLQDHVSRRQPAVDLVLNLLCENAAARLARRAHFDAQAPLIAHDLLRLTPEAGNERASLLGQTLTVDEQIVRYLLHEDGLDTRLATFCTLQTEPTAPADPQPSPAAHTSLEPLLRIALQAERQLILYFRGSHGAGKWAAAAALATKCRRALLVADLEGAATAGLEAATALRLVLRYARLYGAIPYLDHNRPLREESFSARQAQKILVQEALVAILAGEQPWPALQGAPPGMLQVDFTMPGFAQRQKLWRQQLAAAGMEVDAASLKTLASRFRLWPAQIAAAVATSTAQVAAPQPGRNGTTADERPTELHGPPLAQLFAAARAQSESDLGAMARKIEPVYTWDDIVLPADTLTQLREICQRVANRRQVLGEWGFDSKLSLGKGINALFSGPSGTGKTMAAEIIASELGLDLYKIDLAGVVSKYIGETEKNLDRVFGAAQNANAILLFDEADALFGKRSEVRDSHDRYANIEISYLLQKMEEYEGVSILATNLRQNLDESFIRRLAFNVYFPFPDAGSRARIWQRIWPAGAPLSPNLDFDALAAQFKLSGGNIKNVALAGAFLAAEEAEPIRMDHLLRAVRREYQKMGKTLADAELAVLRPEAVGAGSTT